MLQTESQDSAGVVMAEAQSGEQELQWATNQDWEKHRPEITSLYRDENKTLKEVMAFMEEQYQFRATLRMYKRRISRWGIEKNIKAKDVLTVLQSNEFHKNSPGRPSIVVVDGRKIHVSKVEQYIERRRRQTRTMVKKMWRPDNPRPALNAAARFQIPEQMGRLIQQYIDGSFDAGAWSAGAERDQFKSTKSTGIVMDAFNNLFDACALIKRTDVQAGFGKIHQALDIMGQALTEEDPHLLGAVFRVLALSNWYGLKDIHRILSTHLQQLSTVVLGPGHPATRIFAMLNAMTPEDREVGIKIAAELHTRHLQHRVIKSNVGACLHLLMSYIDTLENLGLYEEATQVLVEIVNVPDSRFAWSNETLRLYLQFISRPLYWEVCTNRSDIGIPVGTPVTYVDPIESWIIFAPVLSNTAPEEGTDPAINVMRYCYQVRTETLRRGRGESQVIKGGANMWPSMVTCEDKDRIRILKKLLHRSDEQPGQITMFDLQKWTQFCQQQMPESFCRGIGARRQMMKRPDEIDEAEHPPLKKPLRELKPKVKPGPWPDSSIRSRFDDDDDDEPLDPYQHTPFALVDSRMRPSTRSLNLGNGAPKPSCGSAQPSTVVSPADTDARWSSTLPVARSASTVDISP